MEKPDISFQNKDTVVETLKPTQAFRLKPSALRLGL